MDKLSASQRGEVVAAGIDTAKSTFSVCGLDSSHRILLERTLDRARLVDMFTHMNQGLFEVPFRQPFHETENTLVFGLPRSTQRGYVIKQDRLELVRVLAGTG